LAGLNTGAVSLADINTTVDAINRGFQKLSTTSKRSGPIALTFLLEIDTRFYAFNLSRCEKSFIEWMLEDLVNH
jgi:hypothetical protein